MNDPGSLLVIYLLTTLKFIAGPTLGLAAGFSYIETVGVTVAGMMTSVVIFTYLGEILREKVLNKIFKRQKLFSKRTRRFVIIWQKYGIFGVSFLTPLLFTPIGGTVILTAFGSPRKKRGGGILVSSVFWAMTSTAGLYIWSSMFGIEF